jgi:hypothetical protein
VCWLSFAILTTDLPMLAGTAMALSANVVNSLMELGRRRGTPTNLSLSDLVPVSGG